MMRPVIDAVHRIVTGATPLHRRLRREILLAVAILAAVLVWRYAPQLL